jgi:hypothetical protein
LWAFLGNHACLPCTILGSGPAGRQGLWPWGLHFDFFFLQVYFKSSIFEEGEMAKKEAPYKGEHAGPICVLASSNKFDLIKEITRKPKHVCFNCGRVADSEKNLCNPMPLD